MCTISKCLTGKHSSLTAFRNNLSCLTKSKHPGKQNKTNQILALLLWQIKANYRYEGINKDIKCTPEHLFRWQGQVIITRFESNKKKRSERKAVVSFINLIVI
jgi:hypothetical protein